jgi:hypothetical protein
MKITAAIAMLAIPGSLTAQGSASVAGNQASANIHVLSHLPLARPIADIEIEQELSRPYAYLSGEQGFVIVNMKDLARMKVLYEWHIENQELHQGSSLAPVYVKTKGRYYFFNGFQFRKGGPDADLGAIIWDVTGLPDTSKIREVARIRVPEAPGGFHEARSYKHSNGQTLVFSTSESPAAMVWDIDRILSGDRGLVGKIPTAWSDTTFMGQSRGYHDMYLG